MSAHYEWVIELLDGPDSDDAEILDVNHAPTYAEALEFTKELPFSRIALVRDTDDLRAWAYIEDGRLPDHLEDAFGRYVVAVPGRYAAQFESAY